MNKGSGKKDLLGQIKELDSEAAAQRKNSNRHKSVLFSENKTPTAFSGSLDVDAPLKKKKTNMGVGSKSVIPGQVIGSKTKGKNLA